MEFILELGALMFLSVALKSGGNKSVIDGKFPALSKGDELFFDVEPGGNVERLLNLELLSKNESLDFLLLDLLDTEPPPKKSSQEESPVEISASPPTLPLFFDRSSMGGGSSEEKESFGLCRWLGGGSCRFERPALGRRVSPFSFWFGLEGCVFPGSVSDLERADIALSFALGGCDKAEMARSREPDNLSSSKLSLLSESSSPSSLVVTSSLESCGFLAMSSGRR